ncbi:unnamed protein product [Penicillium nalgiovense]|uniref:C2H2-type domain-containing protein n=1 Tax=Penicillium nalgiovense TaxID=60175 RepID=A0A1V6YMR2_PENNA|nr:hypothetical protein PENNAL_c0016G07040 [Penicillium nalgiovense]CAG7942465.1 unnamed protein product [Penicillium nalgiovense]CAG7967022.1 unnamed protein product [Penicillium nalgiovense]CAG7979523.1 unnamed protein product [Penicillium nalgiovense]CAG7991897.1 unnamed protein product [Penicillium nalgiovense]
MASLGNEINLPPQSPIEVQSHTFRCHFPGCSASYRRKEHLHRHEGKHSQQQAFPCTNCGREFGRSDTLRRHVRRRHGIIEPLKRAQRACEGCHAAKSRCEGGVPCNECIRRKISCSFNDPTSTVGDPSSGSETRRASSVRHDQPRLQSTEKTEQCIRLYFETFHPSWPFIHKATFDIRQETPLLVQSMVVIGLWATREQSAQSAAVELHGKLDSALRNQKEKWDASEAARARSTCVWPIPTYQAILLHIMFSFVLSNRDAIDFDLKLSLPSADLGLLGALVRSCRRLGMFYYPNILAKYDEGDLDSFVWVGIEEIKRFNIALYKVCGKARCSSIRDGNHGDAHAWTSLTAGELQFPLPSNCALWNAVTRDEWDAVAKDEKRVSLDDDRQKDWLSNFAEILQVF